jgi:type I restriction enzyme, S subunit
MPERLLRSERLGDYVSFKTGKLNSNASTANGAFPFFTCDQETLRTGTFSFDCECVLLAGNNATGTFPIKYFRGKFDAYQRTYVIEPLSDDNLDARFLYYSLRLKLELMKSLSTGAATKFLTLAILRSIEIKVPPMPTQRKIAAILSAYDDVIENNSRRIKLLEEMAQRIYREWFVDFRYPGHEGVPIVDSVLGPIPEGWTIGQVGDHVDVIRGRSYLGADVVDEGGIPFINLKCVARDGGFRPDGIKRYVGAFKDAHKATAGDIVMAVTDMTQERRIVARAARVPDVGEAFGVFSMDLVKIVPRDLPAAYVLGLLRYSDFPDEVKAHANGANVLHLHPDRISEYLSAFPLPAIARRYSDYVSPTQHLSDSLQAANERLRITRDLLLPRLISGAIDVTDLDIAIPQAAA